MSVIIYTGCTPQELRCTRCAAAEPLRWPMGVDALLDLSREFQAKHRTCRPAGAPECWGRYDNGYSNRAVRGCEDCAMEDQCRRVTKGLE